MHGLVHAQAFDVRPVQIATANARHGLRVGLRDELNVFGTGQGLYTANQIRQGIASPGNHHRPTFDTAQAVNAFLHGTPLHHIFQIKARGFLHQALHFNGPG